MTRPTPTPRTRILLVEDDDASRVFLSAAAAALPAQVVEVAGCGDAFVRAAREAPFDLWMIDAHLGDGEGVDLLATLRSRHPSVPALAHTASREPQALDELRAAGFDAAVAKPLPAAELREAARALLGNVGGDWNDDVAMAALNQNADHVAGLRELFMGELCSQRTAVVRALAGGDAAAANGVLHRLRASCGFVGAARLGDAVQVLEAAPRDADALARFEAAVEALLARWMLTGV